MAIARLENGMWQARVSYRDGVRYRRRSKNFKRKTEAEHWETDMRAKINSGADFRNANITFADYFDRWVSIYKTDGVAKHTHDMYELTAQHLRHYFPAQKLIDIQKEDYQKFMNLFGSSHGIATSRKTNQQIRSAIQDALAENLIQRDFTFKVKITGSNPKPVDDKFLDLDDYAILRDYLIKHADFEHISSAMLLFQLETGTRFEEAAGMTWDHLDLKTGKVTIDRQWYPAANTFTKTKGNGQADGTITIPENYCRVLKKFKEEAIEFFSDQKLDYAKLNPRGLVFFSKFRRIIINDSANRALSRICAKLEIKRVTTHAMRHTHASYLIQNGASLTYVQHRLRHKKLQTTINTYIHFVEKENGKSDKEAMKLLGKGFNN